MLNIGHPIFSHEMCLGTFFSFFICFWINLLYLYIFMSRGQQSLTLLFLRLWAKEVWNTSPNAHKGQKRGFSLIQMHTGKKKKKKKRLVAHQPLSFLDRKDK